MKEINITMSLRFRGEEETLAQARKRKIKLERLAKKAGVSEAEIIRRAIDNMDI